MYYKSKRVLTLLTCLVLPPIFKPAILRRLGHPVAGSARVGASLVLVDRLAMEPGASIGHLNVIIVRRIAMRAQSAVHTMNIIKGGVSLRLAADAAIGNRNKILRGWSPRPLRPAILRLGPGAKLTAEHYVEMTESVSLGDYTTLAGIRSQIWTHGYIHDETGPGRMLVTGPVLIGHNVYIASGCIVNCGIRIADAVSVGSGACVAKSLQQPGVYVSQALHYLDRRPIERVAGLERIEGATPSDAYYRRRP